MWVCCHVVWRENQKLSTHFLLKTERAHSCCVLMRGSSEPSKCEPARNEPTSRTTVQGWSNKISVCLSDFTKKQNWNVYLCTFHDTDQQPSACIKVIKEEIPKKNVVATNLTKTLTLNVSSWCTNWVLVLYFFPVDNWPNPEQCATFVRSFQHNYKIENVQSVLHITANRFWCQNHRIEE